jgi:hypothetical protein
MIVPFFVEGGLLLARLDFYIDFEIMSVIGLVERVGMRA